MSIAASSLDIWLTPELFVGGPRPTPYGPMDGTWFGAIRADGDASGGTLSISGLLSPRVKRDWVLILEAYSFHNTRFATGDAASWLFPTGAFNPSGITFEAPQFKQFGDGGNGGASDSGIPLHTGGMPFRGLPLYTGNPSPTLNYTVFTASNEANGDGEIYRVALWGWIIRRSQFYHGVRGN